MMTTISCPDSNLNLKSRINQGTTRVQLNDLFVQDEKMINEILNENKKIDLR